MEDDDITYVLAGGKAYLSADDLSNFLLSRGTQLSFEAVVYDNSFMGGAGMAMIELSESVQRVQDQAIRNEAERILAAELEDK